MILIHEIFKIGKLIQAESGCLGMGEGWRSYMTFMGIRFLLGDGKNVLTFIVVMIIANFCEYIKI